MKASIFTSSTDPRFLDDAAASVLAQTYGDLEWLVALGGGVTWEPPDDPRITAFHDERVANGAAAGKKAACARATGEVLLELDHDDVLASRAVERTIAAFAEQPDAACVYSNWAQITEGGERHDGRYNEHIGRIYRETEVDGRHLLEAVAMEPFPSTASRIHLIFAHLRAFRRSAYLAVGGYDTAFTLEDLDLSDRLYQAGAFVHLDECLYLQRVHPGNIQARPELHERFAADGRNLYVRDAEANARSWAGRRGLACVELLAGRRCVEGYEPLEVVLGPDGAIDSSWKLPFADSSVGALRAVDVLHLAVDRTSLMNEIYRVLAHGGMLFSQTPSTDPQRSISLPQGAGLWGDEDLLAYTHATMAAADPANECRFMDSWTTSYPRSEEEYALGIWHLEATIVAVKRGPRIAGVLNI
jgi:hypothetical protein